VLTFVLAPISLFRPIEIWQMQIRRSKISFFIRDLEFGLHDLKARGQLGKRFVLALYPIPFPNSQLALMYRRHLTILGEKQSLLAELFRFVIPIGRIEKKGRIVDDSGNRFKIWNQRTPTLTFTTDEVSKGDNLNRKMFLKNDQPYVCLGFSSRRYRISADYKIDKKNNLGKGISKNLFNVVPTISSYIPMIKMLSENNIAVVRTGIFEDERLPSNLGPLVHDYSFSEQSPFGDVWLHSRCLFSIAGGGSGSHWFASIFKIPCLMVDQFILAGAYGNQDLFIMQLPWLIEERRFASFEWMTRPENLDWAFDNSRLDVEYKLVKNTPQQIIDATDEMLKRQNCTWTESDEDLKLQERLRKVINLWPPHERSPARMGAKFLREHQYLLPD
jgi:putative glycosyltransferase (TIGR04372 family)